MWGYLVVLKLMFWTPAGVAQQALAAGVGATTVEHEGARPAVL